jgi:hypothetical protein
VELSVDNSVETVDEALIARLRQAIAVEEEDDETQLNAVLRMLGAKAPDKWTTKGLRRPSRGQ